VKKIVFFDVLLYVGAGGDPGGPHGEGGGHVYEVCGAATCGAVLHAVLKSFAFAQCR